MRETPAGALQVDFHGEDGRRRTFDFSQLPVPQWRQLLAEAFAHRTGPSGGARTLGSAKGAWQSLTRWARFLATVDDQLPPAELTRAHVDAFYTRTTSAKTTRIMDLIELRIMFSASHMKDRLPAEALDAFLRRTRRKKQPVGGYSHGELERLTAAARTDSLRIARRIRASEDLLRQLASDPGAMNPRQRARALDLAAMAAMGEVPTGPGWDPVRRLEAASRLFLTWRDLTPLLVLMALVSERNSESLKELPARHRILEGRAVELVVTKRRHGPKRWFETVTWEIGPPNRELHTPGGLYLLLLELTARSRAFSGSSSAICIWRNGFKTHVLGPEEHFPPFEDDLGRGASLALANWAAGRRRPLLADPPPDAGRGSGTASAKPVAVAPLPVNFNKIKTSMDARRTKQLGGHLPSSAKSNTAQVLFTNYLHPDEPTREWAEEVMVEALADAERAAVEAHQALVERRGSPTVLPDAASTEDLREAGLAEGTARELATGALDTARAACQDHDHHPETGTACGDSFLSCFTCGNCLVTKTHLPRLLAVLDALAALRQRMSEDEWWRRYGLPWLAVRRDILGKFSPAAVAAAGADRCPTPSSTSPKPPGTCRDHHRQHRHRELHPGAGPGQ
ncbi:hypothetical protein ABT124_35285 [Streptomyces sp. NPDC001982]|uniref:hypothetical protein n=1 Tax=Streptomyces sp. NPDC001982 TaxID=3154405 RepID=UPI003333AC31